MKLKKKDIVWSILMIIGITLLIMFWPEKDSEYIVQYIDNGDCHTEIITGSNQLNNFIKELELSDTKYWVERY